MTAVKQILHSGRLYQWPFIMANVLVVSFSLNGDVKTSLVFGVVCCLVSSYGFLINDIADRATDAVNNAGRLENASPKLIRVVIAICAALLLVSFALSLSLSVTALLVSVAIVGSLSWYSFHARQHLYANFLCASFTTAPLWAPFVIWNENVSWFYPVLIAAAFLLMASREIILDIRDIEGDLATGRRTLPIVFGIKKSLNVASLLTVVGILTLFISAGSQEIVNLTVTLFVLLVASYLFLYPSFRLRKIPADKDLQKSFIFKTRLATMVIPIVVLINLKPW